MIHERLAILGRRPMGLTLLSAWLRRRRVGVVVTLVAALCVMSGLLSPPSVAVGGGVVRTVLFAGMGVSMSAGLLLQSAFGVLERSLLRARAERLFALAAWALVTIGAACCLWWSGGGPTAASWMLLLSGTACAAVTWRAEAAWCVPLSLGLAGITLDLVLPGEALTRALADLGVGLAGGVALGGAMLFMVRGAESGGGWA
jgi:hypothetical protein